MTQTTTNTCERCGSSSTSPYTHVDPLDGFLPKKVIYNRGNAKNHVAKGTAHPLIGLLFLIEVCDSCREKFYAAVIEFLGQSFVEREIEKHGLIKKV